MCVRMCVRMRVRMCSYLQLGKWRFIERGNTLLCIQKQTTNTNGNTQ
jgi:hypothetical protein